MWRDACPPSIRARREDSRWRPIYIVPRYKSAAVADRLLESRLMAGEAIMPLNVSAQAAAGHAASVPMRWMSGSPAAVPSRMPAMAYMPSGKTMVHSSLAQRHRHDAGGHHHGEAAGGGTAHRRHRPAVRPHRCRLLPHVTPSPYVEADIGQRYLPVDLAVVPGGAWRPCLLRGFGEHPPSGGKAHPTPPRVRCVPGWPDRLRPGPGWSSGP